MQFFLGDGKGIDISRIDDESATSDECYNFADEEPRLHDRVHASTVSLPHRSESWLAPQVPAVPRQYDHTDKLSTAIIHATPPKAK